MRQPVLPDMSDRLAAGSCGALVGCIVAAAVTGLILLLPIAIPVGCVLALPSILMLTALTEIVARHLSILHDSFPIWLFAGLAATAPLFWFACEMDPHGRDRLPLAVGLAGLIGSITAWGFYVRRAARMQ